MRAGLLPLYALLVIAGTALEPASARRLAFIGLVTFALGLAAYAVSPGSDDLHAIAEAARRSRDVFFVVNTGMLLLGIALGVAGALLAIHHGPPGSPGRALALLGSGGFALWLLVPLAAASGAWRPAGAALALAATGGAVGAAAVLIGRLRRRPDPPVGWPGAKTGSALCAAGFGLGALGVVAGRHTGQIFVGLWLAALSDFLDRRQRGAARIPWLVIASLLLGPAWWFMATVAGPLGLRLAALPTIPFSPAAERLLALPLGLVAWAFLGLWPMRRVFPDALLAPLGIALWLRVLSPAVAGGLEHWQPLFVPLGVIGLWGAAIIGRGPSACNALAFIALASEGPGSVPAALILGATGLALAIAPAGGPRSAAERLAWMLVALALPFAFQVGFRAQVIYTLLAGAGVALTCWTCLGRIPEPAPA